MTIIIYESFSTNEFSVVSNPLPGKSHVCGFLLKNFYSNKISFVNV